MSFPARVLVVGGGPAGLTAALFFKSIGADVQLFERRKTLDAPLGGGFGMNLGLLAMTQMGYEHVWRRVVNPIEKFVVKDMSRNPRMIHTPVKELHGHFGSVVRNELIDSLSHELTMNMRADNVIHLKKRLVDIRDDDPRCVTAVFSDGSTAEGDLLIGADGIHSKTRRYVLDHSSTLEQISDSSKNIMGPDSLGNRDTGMEIYYGIIDGTPGVERTAMLNHSPGSILLTVPVSKERAVLAFAYRSGMAQDLLQAPSAGAVDATPDRELLAHAILCAGHMLHEPQQTITDRIMRAHCLVHLRCQETVPLPRWSHKRVVLLGDAAHAMTPFVGQGVNQAIVDSFWYAQAFKHCGVSQQEITEAAQRVYEQRHRAVAQWMRASRTMGWLRTALTPQEIFLRRIVLNQYTDPALLFKFVEKAAKRPWIFDCNVA